MPEVRILDADPALHDLLEEWLDATGYRVSRAGPARPDLVIVDLRAPREGGGDVLRRVKLDYPGVPVLALSSQFFAGIGSHGAVARVLGVEGALPKPVAQDALLATVRRLAPAAG
jgi:CheY-like chemotaxis protein